MARSRSVLLVALVLAVAPCCFVGLRAQCSRAPSLRTRSVRVLQRAERVEREDGTALGAAGIGASLVMAWSEWTLKTTGCGLPAGPFGLLGATEGLSYLAVVGLVVYQLFRLATNDTKKQSSLVEVRKIQSHTR
ncbi:unnamed protein product [Durusdinium trenchii]|uniref:Uncharacterized protein n=1 Tax=Durusdinium trenchii TaxID=1381693 RepID=A0ABP0N6M1_9DINO